MEAGMGFYIEMVNVHYGDCFMLTLEDDAGKEHCVLIDGGREGNTANVLSHVSEYAPDGLDLVIGTHLDDDHIGGLSDVLEAIPVRELVLNAPETLDAWLAARESLRPLLGIVDVEEMVEGARAADRLLRIARGRGIPVSTATTGDYWPFGSGIRLVVASPSADRAKAAWAKEVLEATLAAKASSKALEAGCAASPTTASNNASVVLELWYEGNAYGVFTGDAGVDVLKDVLYWCPYHYLKVPHHGSKTGIDGELAGYIRPRVAHIPVGPNHYGHPDAEVREILRRSGATIFCSERTPDCHPGCERDWPDVICEQGGGKPPRPGWRWVDPSRCPANR
jgi:competence protein ComEC